MHGQNNIKFKGIVFCSTIIEKRL